MSFNAYIPPIFEDFGRFLQVKISGPVDQVFEQHHYYLRQKIAEKFPFASSLHDASLK